MKNKVYLDTNIVADMIDSSRANHLQSLGLLEVLVMRDDEICISEDMLSTLYYIAKDKLHTLAFLQNVVLVDWCILSFGELVVGKAMELAIEKSLDLEDILQCLCARENGCTVVVTHDKKFYDCSVSIVTVDEFLDQVARIH